MAAKKPRSFINEHKPHMKKTYPIGITSIKKGNVVTFMYEDEKRYVFVTNPHWEGHLHGLTLKHLPRRLLLPLLEVATRLKEQVMYEKEIDTDLVRPTHSYRLYTLNKIHTPELIMYERETVKKKK